MTGQAAYPARGFDLANVAIQANPYPAYAWLRENAPLFKLDGVPMWVVSRHAEVETILRDHATFASDLGMHVPLMSIVMKDAPDHTRLRQTVNRAFTPRAVAHLAPRIAEIAHGLLDAGALASSRSGSRPSGSRSSVSWPGLARPPTSVDRAAPQAVGARAKPGHDKNEHGASGHDTSGHDTSGHDTSGHDTSGHGASGRGASGHGASGHGTATDFVQTYANPLSVTIICEMLGVPLGQRDAMNRYARDALLASFAATGMGSPELLAEAQVGLTKLMAILDTAIEHHLAHPTDNIISSLVADEARGVLSRDELRNLCALLLIGGHETTANLIAGGAYVLAETPALFRQLKDDPSLIGKFVEELARMRPPLQRIARRTTREVELAGITLPPNTLLMLFPGSANRDPTRWVDPDTLDLAREARGHLGFGIGVHTCPGAPLARMEARIAFEVLLARTASLRFDPNARPIPVAGYAAGNLGWNLLPLIRTEERAAPMPQDLLDPVCKIVADSLGLERGDIDAATCAKNTPEWDSLAHLMILDALEKSFSVKLPRRAAYTAKDVGELATLVATTRAG